MDVRSFYNCYRAAKLYQKGILKKYSVLGTVYYLFQVSVVAAAVPPAVKIAF